MIPINKKGEVVSHEVSQPKRESLVHLVKLSDDNKLESAKETDTFAKIETNKNGRIVDPNFNRTDKLD